MPTKGRRSFGNRPSWLRKGARRVAAAPYSVNRRKGAGGAERGGSG